MTYTIITVKTFREAAEILSSYAFDIGCKGTQFIEGDAMINECHMCPDDSIKIEMFFSTEEDIDVKIGLIKDELESMRNFTNVGEYSLTYGSLLNDAWLHNWKKHYKPFCICDNIVIKPQWEDYEVINESDIVIEIDPGTVFGSGTHETTSLAVSLINKYLIKGQNIIDVGCGTGVLGIIASKLGAKCVTCIDIDKECVAVTKNNISLNKLDGLIDAVHGDLIEKIHCKADIVVANILVDVLVDLTKSIGSILKDNGMYILSGIIKEKQQMIEQKLLECYFDIIEVIEDGEWIAIAARLREVPDA